MLILLHIDFCISKNATLKSLINGEAIIRGEVGKSFKINKRGDPNKRGGWNACDLPSIKTRNFHKYLVESTVQSLFGATNFCAF